MKRTSIRDAFRSPTTRPQAIIWSGVAVLSLAIVAVSVGVIATSTRTFCEHSCHVVQDDAIASYKASAHANISCMACHEPANATPVQFAKAKLKSAMEVIPTVRGTYTFPINKGSAYALNGEEMASRQCTQCHGTNRKVSPVPGLRIDHAIHAEKEVHCTACHNRAGHDESGLKLSLKGNVKHADFTEMDACYRCHGLEGEHEAAGECPTCHTAGFDLVPADHKNEEWMNGGHSEAARESLKEYGAATAEAKELANEHIEGRFSRPVEHCSTCHKRSFCEDCHSKLAKGLAEAGKKTD